MAKISICTSKRVVPMIYAYTTPEIKRHNGWVKIGYTENDVAERIKQQTGTADVEWNLEWKGTAVFDDGTGDVFRDTDFHAYLSKLNVKRQQGTEWFQIAPAEAKKIFDEFRSNRGHVTNGPQVTPYQLRAEQEDAVSQTVAYFNAHPGSEFLWNAKPRFGKTLAVYDFIKRIGAERVLIVTNRPAIANSWYGDYEKFLGSESGYWFISETDSLRGRMLVSSRDEYVNANTGGASFIEFLSLQDLKGSIYHGGEFDKLKHISDLTWDVLVIDEAHEGIETIKTDVAFDNIQRKFTLHLSGTPFKALKNERFEEDAIYNWTYRDEQTARRDWNEERGANPYATLPRLNLFTYQMSEIVRDEVEQGAVIDGESVEYAFDLNEFFRVENGRFVYEDSVDRFLEALTSQEKFPFSTQKLRDELKHTFWLLNRVDSAKALAKKLKDHPIFGEYEIVLAAGDGQMDDEDEREYKKSYDRVVNAIRENDKTITLSVGQLTTGITIPEWSAVLMLCSLQSPSLYMQAAFRAQNPCLYRIGKNQTYRKENAYVFDFDPARTLEIFESFANDLSSNPSSDAETRKENVRELLNFFPVIGEDENGEMVELDAEKTMSIPRVIRSKEVVRRGFMSDFLFQNIHNIFHAPGIVRDILDKLTPCQQPKNPTESINVSPDTAEELSINDEGEVELDENWVIGRSNDIFGDKVYSDAAQNTMDDLSNVMTPDNVQEKRQLARIGESAKKALSDNVIKPFIEKAKEEYGEKMSRSTEKQLARFLEGKAHVDIEKSLAKIKSDVSIQTPEQILASVQEAVQRTAQQFIQDAKNTITKEVETSARKQEKEAIESEVRDHLRGFTRTIPSFLMAYGSDDVTLATFDQIIPAEVFEEVTSITLEQFRLLRDGGEYTDENGESQTYEGHLFDEVVFNDSVKEFMRLRVALANYFDDDAQGDIFDYIPPQKTNQIFTPKETVIKMVDYLEEENPGCFDDPDKTFIDLYMKSGLYIAQIVKRLYQSKKMRRLFPDGQKRLDHIFEKQVFGLAPTEIIYRIATNYILGFDEQRERKHNFRCLDALPAAKAGTLSELLDETFG
ncbi:MAG: DEAD/DEAH box helicase family protein [Thermoguttaceae bacterium]|nr:DEAD/DEAH box helicase family protein [Thermoguttaceae bacterium]